MTDSKKASTPSTSSFDAFKTVDSLVSKPVLGSDGASNWQDFQKHNASLVSSRSSVAPKAPLKHADRAAGVKSWQDEREREQEARRKAGHTSLEESGYTHFKQKQQPKKSKQQLQIEKRIRPKDKDYYAASPTFEGHRFDYVFTTRDRGTGYYWDGMDSLLKLQRGEEVDAKDDESNAKRSLESDTKPSPEEDEQQEEVPKKKKKRKKLDAAPVIVNDPTNPLEQIAAAMQRRQQPPGLAAPAPANTTPLPEGWQEAVDPTSGKTYYFHQSTGQRQWDRPVIRLPAGWSVTQDASTGKSYYYHAATGKTQWTKPE